MGKEKRMNQYEIYQALKDIMRDIEEHEVCKHPIKQATNCYIGDHKITIAKNVCKQVEKELNRLEAKAAAKAVIAGFPPEGS